jgi:GAF domain-containing protein
MKSHITKKLFDEIITEGLEFFSLSMGIVSQIDNDSYEIMAVKSDTNVFVPGEIFPLQKTYCRDVVEKRETIALTNIRGGPKVRAHPLYEQLTLEALISAPIYKGGEIWGTLNFSSMQVRPQPFTNDDIQLIESRADKISLVLSAE